jgi:hypothetical protein
MSDETDSNKKEPEPKPEIPDDFTTKREAYMEDVTQYKGKYAEDIIIVKEYTKKRIVRSTRKAAQKVKKKNTKKRPTKSRKSTRR